MHHFLMCKQVIVESSWGMKHPDSNSDGTIWGDITQYKHVKNTDIKSFIINIRTAVSVC